MSRKLDKHRQQFCSHNFLSTQSDLNFYNSFYTDRVSAVLKVVELLNFSCVWMWKTFSQILLMGAVNEYFHKRKLRGNLAQSESSC